MMILDVETAEVNRVHIDILNNYFGCSYKRHMKADWRPAGVSDWMVWFPKILKKKDGSPKATTEGWCNTISEDGTIIQEYSINPVSVTDHSMKVFKNNPYRITFAYDEAKKGYCFKGVFVTDETNTTQENHRFKRIAAKVELFGYPVTEIQLIRNWVEALDSSHSREELEQHASSISIDDLKRIAIARKNFKYISTTVNTRYRDPYISIYAKRKANGICQLCGMSAPFVDKNGEPYLESHHVEWLSNGGADAIGNVVALCPNCHRKMHIVNDEVDVAILRKKIEE